MLANRLPLGPEESLKDLFKILPDAPSRHRRTIDAHWDSIVLGCLHPDPKKRIASPAEVLRLIERAFAVSQRKQWIVAIAVIILAIAFGLYFRDTVFPPPPLARLAILPFGISGAARQRIDYECARGIVRRLGTPCSFGRGHTAAVDHSTR